MIRKQVLNFRPRRGIQAKFFNKPHFIPRKEVEARKEMKVGYTELMYRVSKYFSFSRDEVIRVVNCFFHELLSLIRDGKTMYVPYFGTFFGSYYPSKYYYNIGLNQRYSHPTIIQRCYPNFYPSPYAVAVCSPKNAYDRPLRYLTPKGNAIQFPWGLKEWHHSQLRYMIRCLMLHDNPRTLLGVFTNYRLKESTATKYPSDTDIDEIFDLCEDYKHVFYRQARKLVKRFTKKDYFGRGKHLYSYYNYLPGKYFVGFRNRFNVGEKGRFMKAEDIVYQEGLKANLSLDHIPEECPDDFVLGDVSQEYTPEATGFENELPFVKEE